MTMSNLYLQKTIRNCLFGLLKNIHPISIIYITLNYKLYLIKLYGINTG